MRFADSHTHIDLAEFDSDRPALLKRAAEAGVVRMLLVAQADDSVGLDRGLTTARDCGIKVSGGLHPHEAISWTETLADRLQTLGESRAICAVGEIGLDFHYDHSPRDQQEEVFRRQIRIARAVKLPIIIHTREADDLTVRVLEEEGADEVGGVIHCFTGTQPLADEALALGFFISFSGIACFANADALRAIAKTVPLDRFLTETDCPFLAPPPHRGKRNEPAFVVDVARRMAEVKGVSLEVLGETTVENFDRLFGSLTMPRTVIVGSGSAIPRRRVPNSEMLDREFLGPDGKKIAKANQLIVEQFEAITGIKERRYAEDNQVTSDLAAIAAEDALLSSGLDRETLDAIIVAHNFGDVRAGTRHSDLVPALAARVKAQLKIANPHAAAFDIIFGCPGWLQGVIVADAMIRAGDIRRAMVIGADTLSRISDPHDRDSLIYADGAGAVILEARKTGGTAGILAHAVRSDTLDHSTMLVMGPSYNEEVFLEAIFLKMEGRKLYKYALQNVAVAIKQCLDKAGLGIGDMKKILIHQANGKMDEAILEALYFLYDLAPPAGVMPMTISWLGNSSVATLPTLFDLVSKGKLEGHQFHPGDNIVFASVGAGMHINAAVYRFP